MSDIRWFLCYCSVTILTVIMVYVVCLILHYSTTHRYIRLISVTAIWGTFYSHGLTLMPAWYILIAIYYVPLYADTNFPEIGRILWLVSDCSFAILIISDFGIFFFKNICLFRDKAIFIWHVLWLKTAVFYFSLIAISIWHHSLGNSCQWNEFVNIFCGTP